jgi:hypothetical protein
MFGMRRCVLVAVMCAVGLSAPGALAASWSFQSTPALPGATSSVLNGVSCPTAMRCMAVGSETFGGVTVPLAERWHGSWNVLAAVNPPGATSSTLNAVSCRSVGPCFAVGSTQIGRGDPMPLIERWSHDHWELVNVPPGLGTLQGVSCPGASQCVAVGTRLHARRQFTLAEVWNGSTWHTSPSVNPDPGYTTLQSVSCAAVGSCVAVGWTTPPSGPMLAEAWDGSTWTLQVPPPFGLSGFSGVSCPLTNNCTGVGWAILGRDEQTVGEGYDGTTWTLQDTQDPVPLVPYPGISLYDGLRSVSCPTTTFCAAVGNSNYEPKYVYSSVPLGEFSDGTNWWVDEPLIPRRGGWLNSVSCSGPSVCTAVGAADSRPLVERFW